MNKSNSNKEITQTKNIKKINIAQAFENGKVFIGFLTAGDPTEEKTVEFILAMEQAGANLVEIGIPFSDPTAEGPIIEKANERALKGGMNVERVFSIVTKVRQTSSMPLVFLTYLNVVFHYGYDAFFEKCKLTGVNGIIIPDLPFEEREEVAEVAEQYDVSLITMIAPTSKERIARLAKEAKGFVYVVSSLGVTGVRSDIQYDIKGLIETIKQYTDTPCAVGFGIHTPEQAKNIAGFAEGVIVGSAIVKLIEEHQEDSSKYLRDYVEKMKASILENN